MSLALIPVTLALLAAYGLLYVGIAFSNMTLLPGTLHGLYVHTTPFARLMIMTVLLTTPVNYVVGKCFTMASPALVTAILLGAQTVILLCNATLLNGFLPARALLAATAALVCLVWFGYEVGSA